MFDRAVADLGIARTDHVSFANGSAEREPEHESIQMTPPPRYATNRKESPANFTIEVALRPPPSLIDLPLFNPNRSLRRVKLQSD